MDKNLFIFINFIRIFVNAIRNTLLKIIFNSDCTIINTSLQAQGISPAID